MDVLGFDIPKALTPDISLVETFVRGTIVYLVVLVMLRYVLRRKSGSVAFTDLLVLVLIADASQNSMSAEYHSITNGLVLVGTIIFWAYALDWLGFRNATIQQFVHPDKLPLVKDGHMIEETLRHELMTEGELMTQLRLQGVEKVNEVRAAYMEGNGQVSVLKMENGSDSGGGSRGGGRPG